MAECQRPLRAQTAQGERVSLANSEEIPAGSSCEFEILCMDDTHEAAVMEWLDYASFAASANGATAARAASPMNFSPDRKGKATTR